MIKIKYIINNIAKKIYIKIKNLNKNKWNYRYSIHFHTTA